MYGRGRFRLVVAAAVVLVALVALAVTQLGPWWRGTKQLSLDTSPHGWA